MNDPYTDTQNCIDRLIKQYKSFGKLIIAFDFDDTIFDYRNEGHLYPRVIGLLKRCSDLDFVMIMFSSKETDAELLKQKEFSESLGIRVDYINESPAMKTVKPYCNLLLDDKSGLGQTCEILEKTLLFLGIL